MADPPDLARSEDETAAEETPCAGGITPPPLPRIVEALLFVGGPPLTAARAADAIRGLTSTQFEQAVDALNQEYRKQARPYSIQLHPPGYQLTLRPQFQPILDRLHGGTREARLSPQAIDALALVAYRQPLSKQEIDGMRGADSGNLLRQLVRRGLVQVTTRVDAAHHDSAYGTTSRFLDLFGLKSLDDLPQTQDLQTL